MMRYLSCLGRVTLTLAAAWLVSAAAPAAAQTAANRQVTFTKDVAPISVKVNPLFSGGASGNYTNVVMINGVKNALNDTNWKPAPATW